MNSKEKGILRILQGLQGFFFTFAAQALEKIASADNKNGSEVTRRYIADDRA